ncbi:MAG: hypothetical protein QNJ94_17760 [Alphaproteobacteria bacterium]|nr:hypothetical protein [Alphaproteobacteria bacterium]
MVVKAVLWAYLGAVMTGLMVAVVGVSLGMAQSQIVALAAQLGMAGGILGLGIGLVRRLRRASRRR